MLIKTVCPECESSFQVDAGLKGKRMRCPNSLCRAVFEVRDAAEAPTAPPPVQPPAPVTPPRTGSVSDFVPVLSGEAVAPPAPPAPRERQPTGPFQPPAAPAEEPPAPFDDFFMGARPLSVSEPGPAVAEGPAFAAWEETPPVRGDGMLPEANGLSTAVQLPSFAMAHEPPRSHRWRWLLAALVVLLATTVGGVIWLAATTAPDDEAQRLARAEQAYKERDFGEAAFLFRSLVKDYPDSPQRGRYLFMAELSDVRDPIHRTQADPKETYILLKRLDEFVEAHKGDPLVEEYGGDVADSFFKLAEEIVGFAARDKNRAMLEDARKVSAYAATFKAAPPARAKSLQEAFDQTESAVKMDEDRGKLLDTLKQYVASPTARRVLAGPVLARKAGLANDPEVRKLLDRLPAAHRESVVFNGDITTSAATDVPTDRPPSLAVVTYRGRKPPASDTTSGRPVLAVVRGVLYAFDPATGVLRWARRVGADGAGLPLWVPATQAAPATILVASSDVGGLVALDASDGSLRWAQFLAEPAAGPPVLLGDRVLVGCRDGAVLEIEVTGGRLLGGYALGQPLRHGGVVQPGTNHVYFAANSDCVYILDAAARRCHAILYTGHAAGALRCSPVVLPLGRGEVLDPSKPPPQRALLLLCLDDGARATQLVTYALPLTEPPPAAVPLGDKLPGQVWFAPLATSEQVAVATNAGAVAVFGIKQRNNLGEDLFPMFRDVLPGEGPADPAVVLHADSQSVWTVSRGKLALVQASQSPQGWKMVPRDLHLDAVGAPLHAAQVGIDDDGHTYLAVVSEAPGGRAFRVTVVDAETRAVRWQRQVGLTPQALVPAGDSVLAWDRGGDLLLFNPDKYIPLPGGWHKGTRFAATELHNFPGSVWLLPPGEGPAVLSVNRLTAQLWRYAAGVVSPVGKSLTLPNSVAGQPARLGEGVVVPLSGGQLVRLDATALTIVGEWRSPQADKGAEALTLALPGGRLAVTNGNRGVVLFRHDGKALQRLGETAKDTLKGRIVGLAALPSDGGELRLVIADATRTVTFLEGDELRKKRTWVLSDDVTAGPAGYPGGAAVVVGRRRLVWLDPAREHPVWALTFPADIVGEPLLLDGVLIVADESGQIQAFAPADGQAVGLRYTIESAVAPAAAPVPHGNDRLFLPLTDGTALLLSRAWFRPRLLGMPLSR